MKKLPKVSLIILNWNGLSDTIQCLNSLKKTTYPNIEVIVIDNGSDNDESILIKKKFGNFVNSIRINKNLGFTGGNNFAIKKASGKYVILLNNDTEVEKDFIEPLVEVMENDMKVSVAQPKIKLISKRDHFDYSGAAGGYIDKYGYPFTRGRIFDEMEKDNGQYDDMVNIFWASGAAMMIRRSAIKKVGGLFDEAFFNYMEEIDFCWRVWRKGYKVVFIPFSTIYHRVASTSKRNPFLKRFWEHRNNLLILVRNLPRNMFIKIVAGRIFLEFITYLNYFFSGKYIYIRSLFMAHLDFLRKMISTRIFRFRVNGQEGEVVIYPGSVVVDYFVFKKRHFSDLNWTPKPKICYLIYSTKENTGNKVIFGHANKLIELGYDVVIYTIFGNKPRWYDLGVPVRNFIKSFVDWKPDLLVSTFWPTSYLSLIMKAKKRIYFLQEWEEDFYKNPILRIFARFTYTLPLDKVVISRYLQNRVRRFDRSGKSVKRITYATLNSSIFRLRKNLFNKHKDNQVKILSVISWYNKHKGPDLLVEAVRKLKSLHPNYHFTLVSLEKKPYRNVFDKFISDPGQKYLPKLYQESDIFLITSRSEGFYIPGLEAMASGCPVITTNCGGILDYAVNGKNAVILDNLEDLWKKDVIEKTLKDKERLKRMIAQGCQTSRKFDSKFLIKDLEKIYAKLIS